MNDNFTEKMITPKLLKACGDQVNKYFYGPMDDACEICLGVKNGDCSLCPLGDIGEGMTPCSKDSTYLGILRRLTATKEQLLARGNRLIEILDQHGITIYDKRVK